MSETRVNTKYIPEIVGLRGLALAVVVAVHLFGGGRVWGALDVFLFLSGFLLTLSLLRKVEREGGFSLVDQVGRTLRRLAPSALVVLGTVAIGTLVLLPRPQWLQVGREILASALYVENWALISSQLAYGAAGPATSPVQHFWSMAVQGQFFLGWPLAVGALLLVVRRTRFGLPLAVGLLSAVATIASLWFAQQLFERDQAVNYFHTGSRLWQLTLGALLATVHGRLRPPRRAKSFMGWLGLGAILGSGFVIDGAKYFPAYPALVPVLGAALVVMGSGPNGRWSVGRALNTAPLSFLARISYPLYLWHWPVLVFGLAYRNNWVVFPRTAVAVVAISVVLAWLTQILIAEPALRGGKGPGQRRSALGVVAAMAAFVLTAGVAVAALARWEARELAALPEGVSAYHPGSLVLTGDAEIPSGGWVSDPRPRLAIAERDLPALYASGCVQPHGNAPGTDEVLVCDDPAAERATRRIVMSGGSHALHWFDALNAVAERHGWAVLVVDKDGCRLAMPAQEPSDPNSCDRWNASAREVILGLEPDAMFTVGTVTPTNVGGVERVLEDQVRAWRYFGDRGVPMILVRDTPRFLERVPECLARMGLAAASACGRSEADVYLAENPLHAVDLPSNAAHLDLRHAFCREGRCEVVIGNVVAYRDDDHMTATYAKTTWLALERELMREAPWLFEANR